MDDFSEVNGFFVISLLKILSEKDKLRNLFFCFMSVFLVLVMVYFGVKGNIVI